MIIPGIYQHYKGDNYQVIGLSRHSETLEELVVYQALYGEFALWVRPVYIFTEEIVYKGENVPRFKFISEVFTKAPSVR